MNAFEELSINQKDEWFRIWHELRLRLFAACRESKDGYARNGNGTWTTPAGFTFREEEVEKGVISIEWEEVSPWNLKNFLLSTWVPNKPYSPLEKLAECAE